MAALSLSKVNIFNVSMDTGVPLSFSVFLASEI
jgi:hypothetical protein